MIILYDISTMISIARKIDPELSQGDLLEIFIFCITKDNDLNLVHPTYIDGSNRRVAETVRRLWRFMPGYNFLDIEDVQLAPFGRVAIHVDEEEFYDRNPNAIPRSKSWREYTVSTTQCLFK